MRVHCNGSHTALYLRAFFDVPSLTLRRFQRAPDHTSFPFLTPIRLFSLAFSLFQGVHPLRRPLVVAQ